MVQPKRWTTEKTLVVIAMALMTTAIYARTWINYYQGWHIEENQQGWLVLPLFTFLIWLKWPALKQIPIKGNIKAGAVVLGLALLIQVAGVWLGLNRSVGYSFIFAIVGMSLYFLGNAMTLALAFPLAFLLFMVPTPGGVIDEISSPLQRFSADTVEALAGLLGVNVSAEGVTLILPSKGISLEVAEGCSGLHSLTAMTMLAAIIAYLANLPLRWKWALFALALPVALIGNIVRILFVVLIANQQGEKAGMAFHDSAVGQFLPFMIAAGIVYGTSRLIEWRLSRPKREDDDFPAPNDSAPPGASSSIDVPAGAVAKREMVSP